jgi:hypothetical protein
MNHDLAETRIRTTGSPIAEDGTACTYEAGEDDYNRTVVWALFAGAALAAAVLAFSFGWLP